MAGRKFLAALVGLALCLSIVVPSGSWASNSTTTHSSISPTAQVATGLIVQLRSPVTAFRYEDFLKLSPSTSLAEVRALGAGLFSFDFEHPLSVKVANRVLQNILASPKVESATLERSLTPEIFGSPTKEKISISTSAKVRAGAVGNLTFSDTWNPNLPERGSVRVTWKQPRNLAGAKFYRYQVEVSINGGVSYLLYSRSSKPSANLSNLTPGKKYIVRVAAIVKKQSKYYLGTSKRLALTSTAIPRSPILTSPASIKNSSKVFWLPQTAIARGGLSVSYKVVATSGVNMVICESSTTSCFLELPTSSLTYQISITATNDRGTSPDSPPVTIQDRYFEHQWYLSGEFGINAENAWRQKSTKSPVTVAVIDSGITNHVDLSGSLWHDSDGMPYGFDFVSSSNDSNDGDGWDSNPSDPGDFSNGTQSSWHGTVVSGLIAAEHNLSGIAGASMGAKLLSVRAIGADGGRLSDLLAAVNWSAGISVPGTPINLHPARIINVSLASQVGAACDATSQAVFKRAADLGVLVVVAAGNESENVSESFPANCSGVTAVAATNSAGELSDFSNFGNAVTVAAPGGGEVFPNQEKYLSSIISLSNLGLTTPASDAYIYATGTSLSAPLVSAAFAMVLSANPNLSRSQVIEIVKQTARPFRSDSPCNQNGQCGTGIIDTAAAVEGALLRNW